MCLSLPSKCGDLQPVPNGNVTVFGTYQDDVSEVTCNVGYVASPRGVSLAQRCLITSVWSTLEGTCKQSKFWKMEQAFVEEIPWALTEHSKMCVKGVFNDTSQITVNLKQTSGQRIIHMAFRYEADKVIWNVRNEGNWQPELERYLGPMPLVPGDSLNLTLHVQSDRLQYTLNEAYVYTIPLLGVNNNTDGVKITDISMLVIEGPVSLTFINLVEGC
ncbi:hypothetical protein V1264_002171 [Littorina saxatilis]|uniref:Galectin n=1 Tax=Littorina saxatilis TaxID=31220 RepID=A0AAN9C3I5_9CAEN